MCDSPAPHVNSGKGPDMENVFKSIHHSVKCLGIFAICFVCVFVACNIIVLIYSYNKDVLELCGGYWDFVALSILSPLLMPFLYCFVTWFTIEWNIFAASYCFCLFLLGVIINVNMSSECFLAIRKSTPTNIPWLFYFGCIKCIFFLSYTLSILMNKINNSKYCYYNSHGFYENA